MDFMITVSDDDEDDDIYYYTITVTTAPSTINHKKCSHICICRYMRAVPEADPEVMVTT